MLSYQVVLVLSDISCTDGKDVQPVNRRRLQPNREELKLLGRPRAMHMMPYILYLPKKVRME